MDLIEKFKNYIKNNSLVSAGDAILLGVSGGPDSLTMFDLFNRIRDDYNLSVSVFHLNHKFRPEAEQEADFVAGICEQHNIRAFIEEYDIPALIEETGLSPEEAARDVRFKLLKKKASVLNLKKIALAHNKDDLVETVFLHMFRGTGMKGLTGIDPVTEIDGFRFIHPFLNISRSEIEDYCQLRELEPVIDPTNKKTIYTRNKIRHKIIPYIEDEINPGLKNVIYQMANIIRNEDNYLQKQVVEKMPRVLLSRHKNENKLILSLEVLKGFPEVIRRRIVQKVVYELKDRAINLYHDHFQAIDNLIFKSSTGKQLDLPDNIKVKKVYDKIIFKKGNFNEFTGKYNFKLEVPGMVELPGNQQITGDFMSAAENWYDIAKSPAICLCDADRVILPLQVRNRRPGDKFYPLGMTGIKKVKDFFIDEKIPQVKRDLTPIITDKEERIIWIGGLRIDDRFKVTRETRKIIKLLYKEKGDR